MIYLVPKSNIIVNHSSYRCNGAYEFIVTRMIDSNYLMFNIFDVILYQKYNMTMETKRVIGEKIKTQRLFLNLKMDKVAKEIGITRSTLWSIENGKGNYSIDSLIKLLRFLDVSINIEETNNASHRIRATRTNTSLDKKINRFIIMCVEQYASYTNKRSNETYLLLNKHGIIDELIDDYEDMHGMSTYSINEYIDKRLKI